MLRLRSIIRRDYKRRLFTTVHNTIPFNKNTDEKINQYKIKKKNEQVKFNFLIGYQIQKLKTNADIMLGSSLAFLVFFEMGSYSLSIYLLGILGYNSIILTSRVLSILGNKYQINNLQNKIEYSETII